jgi:hypothetical protein
VYTYIDRHVLVYVQRLFYWAVDHQYFDLLMSICTRLEVEILCSFVIECELVFSLSLSDDVKDSIIGILLVYEWCTLKEKNNFMNAERYRTHRQYVSTKTIDLPKTNKE